MDNKKASPVPVPDIEKRVGTLRSIRENVDALRNYSSLFF